MDRIDIRQATRRSGKGWVTWVSPTCLLMILDEADESAAERAMEDLREWGTPSDWVLEESGYFEDGTDYYLYAWEPAGSQVGNDSFNAVGLPPA